MKTRKNTINLNRVTTEGVTYVDPKVIGNKMNMNKGSVVRIMDLFEVKCICIGRTLFYDELMATVVSEAWEDEESKVRYMRMGVSQEFEKRLKNTQ